MQWVFDAYVAYNEPRFAREGLSNVRLAIRQELTEPPTAKISVEFPYGQLWLQPETDAMKHLQEGDRVRITLTTEDAPHA